MGKTTPPRRALLAGALGVGTAALVAGCDTSSSASQGGQAASPAEFGEDDFDVLARASEVPLNGGVVNNVHLVIVTQPASGQYRAFTAICTHAGCTVGEVKNNVIMCPCHGSHYSAVDGSVIQGPAPQPLGPKKIKVDGDLITLD